MTRVTLVAAVARSSRVIGKDGDLPWRLSADLKRFKATTLGHPIIMGRKTCQSIGRALPGRRNIVLSRSLDYMPPDGVEIAKSLDDALALACGPEAVSEARPEIQEVFVIGGEGVYVAALPRADRLILTWVDGEFDGDAYFPPFDEDDWEVQSSERVHADDRNSHDTEVVILDRARGPR